MLKVGLVGIGFMGRGHLDNYIRLKGEGADVALVAICDIDPNKFENKFVGGNIAVGGGTYDFTQYHLYTDLEVMLATEQLDMVDIALPTYLHAWGANLAMEAGCHVLCEKPMAMNVAECDSMIETSQKTGKKLMIGQCLRFWPAYQELKRITDSGEFGGVSCAYFFRGGGTPVWSYEGWLMKKDKAGGALLDQHIHDVDTIQWLFGTPKAVSCSGKVVFEGSGYDAVSTNYVYDDNKVVNAQDDWTINGQFGFEMIFRVCFEKGAVVLTPNGLTVYPFDGEKYVPELSPDMGYYREMAYFIDAVQNDTPITACCPKSTRETIRIAQAEQRSADNGSALVAL